MKPEFTEGGYYKREDKQRHLVGDAMLSLSLAGRGVGSVEMGEKGPLYRKNYISQGLESTAWLQGWESGDLAGAQQAGREAVGSELEGL